MQALSDDQRIETLESKVDNGFAELRTEVKDLRKEMREDLRGVREETKSQGRSIQMMWLTMILGFAGILLQHHL